jgi:hypothetical protein
VTPAVEHAHPPESGSHHRLLHPRTVFSVSEMLDRIDRELPIAVVAELRRLRAENARLLRRLDLTLRKAAPPGPAQAGFFEALPGPVHAATGVLAVALAGRAPRKHDLGFPAPGGSPSTKREAHSQALSHALTGTSSVAGRLGHQLASIDSRVSLLPTEERGFKLAVEVDVTLPQVQDPEQAARIVAAAIKCARTPMPPLGNIDVTLTVNGRDIG